jgi:glutathione synthase/RimK-type ligase-like ATP-grasp enzyme
LTRRNIVSIITQICAEEGIDINLYSDEWVISLAKQEITKYIHGYAFPNNESGSALVCSDKSALYTILEASHIPAVRHDFFMAEGAEPVFSPDDIIKMNGLLRQYGRIVCKNNNGTGGVHVFCVTDEPGLLRAVQLIARFGESVTISPFVDIESEYRVILLDGHAEIVYEKEIANVKGDGQSTVSALTEAKYQDRKIVIDPTTIAQTVPCAGDTVKLHWKHNLSFGASAVLVTDPQLRDELSSLAVRAAHAASINFTSVDIIKPCGFNQGEAYSILEINSGVMMERFSEQSEEHRRLAVDVYRKAVRAGFGGRD